MSDANEQMKHWLAELSRAHGNNFTLDEQDRCFLSSSNGVRLVIHAPRFNSQFYLSAQLQLLPTENKEAVFEQALTLNLFQQETRGAAISIDAIANALVLCYCREIEHTNYTDFYNIVNNIIDTAADIRSQLQTPTTANIPDGTFNRAEFRVQV